MKRILKGYTKGVVTSKFGAFKKFGSKMYEQVQELTRAMTILEIEFENFKINNKYIRDELEIQNK